MDNLEQLATRRRKTKEKHKATQHRVHKTKKNKRKTQGNTT
jgi:hypothetical protein